MKPGDVLAKKYRVTRLLGAGGMGVVVAADDVDLDRRVAVKFLSAEGAQNSNIVARFMREARAAVKITSEHVAKVIEVGRLETGEPYIVMEFLEGHDLSDVVAKGALPIADAIEFLLQACEAIAEAHAKGIVHRDLKPANLFLSQRADGSPMVKVLDFGISSMADASTEHALTRTGAIMGSPFYMSPEQAKSARTATARSDIWSLGAVLFELLAGRPPFTGETMGELLSAILTEATPPLRKVRPEVPEGLEAVVHRCLEKDPSARFASVGELAQALGPFAPPRARVSMTRAMAVSATESADSVAATGTVVMAATEPGAAPRPDQAGANTAAAWAETHAPRAPSRSWVRGALAGVVALGAVGLLFALTRFGTSGSPAAPSASAAEVPAAAAIAASPAAEPAPPPSVAPPASSLPPTAEPASGPTPTKRPPGGAAKPAAQPSPDPTPSAKPPPTPKPAASAKTPSLSMPLE